MTNYYSPSNPYAALNSQKEPTFLEGIASGSDMFNKLAGQQAQREYAGGDNAALRQLTAYQPENASKLAYANTQQALAQKQQMENQGKLFEATYQAVVSAKDPEAKKQAYETMLGLNKSYGVQIPNLPDLQQYTPNTEATLANLRQLKQQQGFEGKSQFSQVANLRAQEYIDAGYAPDEAYRKAANDYMTMPKQYYNAQTGPTVTESAGFAPVGAPKGTQGTITGESGVGMTPPPVTSASLTPAPAIDQNEYMQMPPPKEQLASNGTDLVSPQTIPGNNIVEDPRTPPPQVEQPQMAPTVTKKAELEKQLTDIGQKMEAAKSLPIREQSMAMSALNNQKTNLQSQYDKTQKRYDLLVDQKEKYSDKVDKAGLGELVGTFSELRNDLDKYGDEVPGTGLDTLKPDWLLSDAGIDMRQKMFGLGNVILKARSGGAVTPTEAQRAMKELGISFSVDGQGNIDKILDWKPTRSFKNGIENVGRQLKDKMSNLQGSVDGEALDMYKQSGGTTTLEKLAQPATDITHPIKGRLYSTPDGKLWEWDGSKMGAVK